MIKIKILLIFCLIILLFTGCDHITIIGKQAPATPDNFAVNPLSSESTEVTWVIDSSEGQISGFIVEYSKQEDFTYITSEMTSAHATSKVITGQDAETMYYYRIRAFNADNSSANSKVISVMSKPIPENVPDAPTGLKVTSAADPTRVDVTWNDESDSEIGFFIEWDRNNEFINSESYKMAVNSTGAIITNLIDGAFYSYRVRAYNAAGDSDWSNVITFATSGENY